MHVVLVNHYAGSERHGMEFRPLQFAREWAKQGVETTIVAASFSHLRRENPTFDGPVLEETIDGVRYRWLRTPAYEGNGARRFWNMLSFVRALGREPKRFLDLNPPDVVVASSTYPLDIHPTLRWGRRYGVPVAFELHDLWPLSPIELGGMSPKHPFIRIMQRAEDRVCRESDLVVSILPRAIDHLSTRGLDPSRYVVVPNGADLAAIERERTELPTGHAAALDAMRTRGERIVCYAGAHGPANDLETLLDAADHLRDEQVAVVLVGGGSEKERLRAIANDRGLDNVTFLDAIPRTAMPALLERCDILYIGLQKQSLFRFGIGPNKLIDYMAAARPIIQAIDAGNDPVGEAACGRTIAPGDSRASAEAIRELARLPEAERARLGANARAFVAREHDLPKLAERFLDALREVASRSSKGAAT